jgi:UDPglucose 6-dehydrogenase
MTSISVIGTGYLGAVHAACMAELGHDVVGIDNDRGRIEALVEGRAPFFEPGLDDLLMQGLASGRLRFTSDLAEGVSRAEIHFVCVGTPQRSGSYAADLRHVDAAVVDVARHAPPGSLIVGKSTVPVGTAARLAELIRDTSPHPDGVALVWNPEFLREGFAVDDTLHPDRLVAGSADPVAAARLREFYAPLVDAGVPYLDVDLATAELAKTAANAFLATKISFINAMADLCDASGADVRLLADVLGHDARIGPQFLRAGLGFGGGCLPKDIRALMARAGELGVSESLTFLSAVDHLNMARRTRAIDLVRDLAGGRLLGTVVACLGAAFKPDSDDVRDSPALNVAAAMQLQGAAVRVVDPAATETARRVFPTLDYVDSVKAAVDDADVVVLLTEWREFVALTPADLEPYVRGRAVVDARNVWDPATWKDAGWAFRALGRS